MKKLIYIACSLSMVALLDGCAVNKADCDPQAIRNAGMGTKWSCGLSNSYEERQQDKQAELSYEQQKNVAYKQVLQDLEATNVSLSSDIQARRTQLNSLTKSLNNYLAQVQKTNGGNREVQARVTQAQTRLNELNTMSNSPKPNDSKQIEQMKQVKDQLAKDIKDLNAKIIDLDK